MAWEFTYAGLAERGVLLDLNTMLAHDKTFAAELRADSVASMYETFTYNGGQYAFPEQWSGTFLYYNKKLFAEAGVRPPPGRWDQPWSFGEFLDAARALTKRDRSGRVSQWGFVDTWAPYYSALMFGMNNGVPWSDPRMNPTHLNFDDAAFIEGIQFYADLNNKYRVAPTASESQSMSQTDLFTSGHAAMALGGHWRYQTLERAPGPGFRHRCAADRPERACRPLEYRYHRAGHRIEQPPQKAGVGVREIRHRAGGTGGDRRNGPVRTGAAVCGPIVRFCQGA